VMFSHNRTMPFHSPKQTFFSPINGETLFCSYSSRIMLDADTCKPS
jgi:hypothetical protein